MPNSLKSTLEYFAGKPNLASQVKLQKLDKAGVLRNGNKDITFHTIFYTMTNKGVMRWSLLTILPFVVLAIISSQVRMTQSSEVSPSQCENYRIFLSFRFYVKSILETLEVLKLPFLPFLGL